ncbi:MAG: hypothetical protein E7180_01320 [Erysipelotrichaceae bacterium]|nr:hypothetical protein [Erysipelotrichaceae bacterium]
MSQTKEINTVQFNLTYDEIFKGSFSDSSTATKLINIVLNEDIDENDVSITSSELLGESIEIKSSFFDVRIKVANEYDIDLEMQKYKPTSYSLTNRLIFYLSKMISSSVKEGENYTSKACVSIVFMDFSIEDYNKCINEIELLVNKEQVVSKHKIILIDLTKKDKCDNLKLSKWLNLMTSNDVLSFKGEDEIMDKVIKKVIDLNANDKLLAQMMSREKFIRDQQAEEYHKKQLDEKIEKGQKELEEGQRKLQERQRELEEGQKELQEGQKELQAGQKELQAGQKELEAEKAKLESTLKESKLEIAKKMKDMGLDIEVISKTTSLSEEEISKL